MNNNMKKEMIAVRILSTLFKLFMIWYCIDETFDSIAKYGIGDWRVSLMGLGAIVWILLAIKDSFSKNDK